MIALVAVGLIALAATVFREGDDDSGDEALPTAATYVDEATCKTCHPAQSNDWLGSHHDLAMQEATDETVLGDFTDRTFALGDLRYRFFKSDDQFLVNTAGEDGVTRDFPIRYTFGVEPLQQYLVELDRGRLQALTVAWDPARSEWFSLYDEPIPPGDPMHWTGIQFNWNYMCAECHSTKLEKNYNPSTRTYKTTWAQIDVGCQSCHGPASEHLNWAREQGSSPNAGFASAFTDARSEVETCAVCHSRRDPLIEGAMPGDPFLDHHVPALLDEDLYHADGQILDEVYVYGSFLQSKMHQRGVRCSDCHDPHTARLRLPLDETCTRCHNPDPPDPFVMPSPKRYDVVEHHHHPVGGPGTSCVDCHMPSRTYMQVDPRRDHSFRVPRPDLAADTKAPDACTGCHEDQGAEWSAARIAEWFPDSEIRKTPHYGEILAAGRRGDPGAASALLKLAEDEQAAAIVRATATSLLGTLSLEESRDAFGSLQHASDPLLRQTVASSWAELLPPGYDPALAEPISQEKVSSLLKMLNDPIRAVRIEAANALSELPGRPIDATHREAYQSAIRELIERLDLQADRPEAQLSRGALLARLGRPDEAETAYREAIAIDPTFDAVRFNLGNLLHEMGRSNEAIAVFTTLLDRPGETGGEAHYSLGLLHNELNDLAQAEIHLNEAARRLSDRPNVLRNLGLARQQLGRPIEAESAFRLGLSKSPDEPNLIHALAILLIQQERLDEALYLAGQLEKAAPGPASARFRREVESLQQQDR